MSNTNMGNVTFKQARKASILSIIMCKHSSRVEEC